MNIYEDQKNKEKYCKTTNLVGKFLPCLTMVPKSTMNTVNFSLEKGNTDLGKLRQKNLVAYRVPK